MNLRRGFQTSLARAVGLVHMLGMQSRRVSKPGEARGAVCLTDIHRLAFWCLG